MERDQNIMPELHIGVREVAGVVFDGMKSFFRYLPEGGYPSEYPKHPERHSAVIQPQLPFSFDSEGRYIDPAEY